MQFSLNYDLGAYTIRSYGPGRVVVLPPLDPKTIAEDYQDLSRERVREERVLTRSAIITPTSLIDDWAPQSVAELTPAHLAPLLTIKPEIVILGSGARLQFPPQILLRPLYENRIGVEVMDTAAACRTYNFLMVDGRTVAVALMMI